ncbi:MAG: GTPase Era [Anaerolineaceae bacterium]|nr:GTPase Era [Anaerolineaceae bacterium]
MIRWRHGKTVSDTDNFLEESLPDDHRSGFVAVVGRPNVGKSTLINAILGQKIAIVTPRPQTTQRQQLGIYTEPQMQIIFVDTPGLHNPQHKLGEFMVKVAEDALRDADVVLWVLDISVEPTVADKHIADTIQQVQDTPVILALNKADLLDDANAEAHIAAYQELVPHDLAMLVSALNNDGVSNLIGVLAERLPEGPRFYPPDQVSEVNMRFIAAEVIREKIMLATEQEIPHSVAVEIVEYKERSETMTYISAIIYVERDSQKGIIIGKGGSMIKKLGQDARAELEPMLDTQVYLDLQVKVLKNWRSDDRLMRRLGYRIARD